MQRLDDRQMSETTYWLQPFLMVADPRREAFPICCVVGPEDDLAHAWGEAGRYWMPKGYAVGCMRVELSPGLHFTPAPIPWE